MKSHSKAFVFFALSKQIPVVYLADRGRAETNKSEHGHDVSTQVIKKIGWANAGLRFLGQYIPSAQDDWRIT